jgi:glucose-6-phosphate isomerase
MCECVGVWVWVGGRWMPVAAVGVLGMQSECVGVWVWVGGRWMPVAAVGVLGMHV